MEFSFEYEWGENPAVLQTSNDYLLSPNYALEDWLVATEGEERYQALRGVIA